jgi:ABC-type glycerol-3-phosphate transport system permease component
MLVFVIVFRVLAEAQTYTSVALLTGGGPYGSTELTSVYGFQLAFQDFEFGLASAMGTLAGTMLLAVALIGVGLIDATPGKATVRALTAGTARLRALAPKLRKADHIVPAGPRPPGGMHRPPPAPPRRSFALTTRRWRRLGLVLAGVLGLVTIAPFVGGLPGDIAYPDFRLPWSVIWSAISRGLWNSGLVTVATLAGTMLLAIPIAYVLARSRLRFRRTLFFLVLLALAIPGMVLLLPQYLELARMGLVNTRLGVVLLYIAADMPLAVFFLRPAFAAVPSELVEAMRVDGREPRASAHGSCYRSPRARLSPFRFSSWSRPGTSPWWQ